MRWSGGCKGDVHASTWASFIRSSHKRMDSEVKPRVTGVAAASWGSQSSMSGVHQMILNHRPSVKADSPIPGLPKIAARTIHPRQENIKRRGFRPPTRWKILAHRGIVDRLRETAAIGAAIGRGRQHLLYGQASRRISEVSRTMRSDRGHFAPFKATTKQPYRSTEVRLAGLHRQRDGCIALRSNYLRVRSLDRTVDFT